MPPVEMANVLELDRGLCGQCGGCVAVCSYQALELFVSGLTIKPELCTLCQNCVVFCPVGALRMTDTREEITHGKNR